MSSLRSATGRSVPAVSATMTGCSQGRCGRRRCPTSCEWPPLPLDGDDDVDVAIVGGGYTGLWTALYLAEADPALRIVVLEAEHLGHGASGRNGGWCSALLATGLTTLAERHGRDAAIAMQRAMQATVDEVGKVLAAEGDDAGFTKGGTVSLARTAAQEQRLAGDVDEARSFGFGPDDLRWLDAGEVEQHCHATSVRSARVHAALRGHPPLAPRPRRRRRRATPRRAPPRQHAGADDRAPPSHDCPRPRARRRRSSWRRRPSPSTFPDTTAT